MMTRQMPLIALVSLSLAGCVSLDKPAPKAPPMAAWSAPATGGEQAVALDWWKAFGDQRLNALVAAALARNADLRAADANLAAALALAGEARAAQLPAGTVSGGLVRGRVAGLSQPAVAGSPERLPSQTLATVGASLGWELDLSGRLRAYAASAMAGAEEARWLKRQTEAAIVAGVVRAYAEYGDAGYALDIGSQRVKALEAVLQSGQRASELGAMPLAEVERYRQALAIARADLTPLSATQSNAARRLAVLTGETPRPTIEAARALEAPQTIAAGNPTGLLRRRPDVAAAEQRWAAAAASARVAVADLYPRITFGSQASLSAKPDKLGDSGALGFGIGPSLSWGLFDMPRLRSRVVAADAGARAALAQWEAVVLNALEEADSSLETWDQMRNAAREANVFETAGERLFRAAKARHGAGTLSSAALEAARADYLATQSAAHEANARSTQAWIAAQLALGAGWGQGTNDQASRSTQ